MGFEIEIGIGGGEKVTMRGANNGTIEFCKLTMMKNKEGVRVPTLVPYAFYNTLESAFNNILKLRICRSDSDTLEELLGMYKKQVKRLQEQMEGIVPAYQKTDTFHKPEQPTKTSKSTGSRRTK